MALALLDLQLYHDRQLRRRSWAQLDVASLLEVSDGLRKEPDGNEKRYTRQEILTLWNRLGNYDAGLTLNSKQ